MNEPTHAPGWRGRPKRTGPIVDQTTRAVILDLLLYGCFGLGILTSIGAFLLWLSPGQ